MNDQVEGDASEQELTASDLNGLDLGELVEASTKTITARGTEDGLILRIDGRAEWREVIHDIETFLGSRKKFFQGGEVSIEWLDRLPTKEQCDELEVLLKDVYGISIVKRPKKQPPMKVKPAESNTIKARQKPARTVALFDEDKTNRDTIPLNEQIERIINEEEENSFSRSRFVGSETSGTDATFSVGKDVSVDEVGKRYLNKMSKVFGEDPFFEDDANAKIVFGTLRSGQKVETPFSLVVIGDVNPGADLIAGGDIIVFGSLRGTAHAGAYDEDSFDKVIVSLAMRPMQLRIGSIISRGSDEVVKGAEIARIDSRRIIVEAFNPRVSGKKQRLL